MSDTSTPLPAPGWYDDPQDDAQIRYWDGSAWTDQTRAVAAQQEPAAVPAQPAQPPVPAVLVVTTDDIPGYRITSVAGQVLGLTVRTRNSFTSRGPSYRAMSEGDVDLYTKLLLDSRRDAVDRLRVEAAVIGANAVVAMRYDTGQIADLISEVAAYGTAVTVEPV